MNALKTMRNCLVINPHLQIKSTAERDSSVACCRDRVRFPLRDWDPATEFCYPCYETVL